MRKNKEELGRGKESGEELRRVGRAKKNKEEQRRVRRAKKRGNS